jgi:hypothetical protein
MSEEYILVATTRRQRPTGKPTMVRGPCATAFPLGDRGGGGESFLGTYRTGSRCHANLGVFWLAKQNYRCEARQTVRVAGSTGESQPMWRSNSQDRDCLAPGAGLPLHDLAQQEIAQHPDEGPRGFGVAHPRPVLSTCRCAALLGDPGATHHPRMNFGDLCVLHFSFRCFLTPELAEVAIRRNRNERG